MVIFGLPSRCAGVASLSRCCGAAATPANLTAQAEVLEDARDPDLLLREEGRELVRRLVHVHPAALLDDRPPLGALAISPMAASSAFLSLGRTLPGAIRPRQLTSSTSTPCSLKVGMSTPRAARARMPKARSLPAWSCWAISFRPPVATVMWPPMTEASISPPAPATM